VTKMATPSLSFDR